MNRDEPVVVVSYDAGWPRTFAALRESIAAVLGELAVEVEHVGGTAIPGMAAKPIVDVDVIIRNDTDLPAVIERLSAAGYMFLGDLGIAGREAFAAPPGSPPHHLYVCTAGSTELRRHLLFRDALRADPSLAAQYAALKTHLAALYRDDRDAYAEGKTTFIAGVLHGLRGADARRGRRVPRR